MFDLPDRRKGLCALGTFVLDGRARIPVGFVLDWIGLAPPPLPDIARMAPMIYRIGDREIDGRPIAGRVRMDLSRDVNPALVGKIQLSPALRATARHGSRLLFLNHHARSICTSWARRESPVSAAPWPAPLPLGRSARLADDDGVIVLASRRGLARRYQKRTFDYDFPRELLAGARAAQVFAWTTGVEDTVTVSVSRAPRRRSIPPEFRAGTHLQIERSDLLLAMSYAGFTMMCSDGGDTPPPDGAGVAFAVPPGMYQVGVRRLGRTPRFEIVLVPGTPTKRSGPRSLMSFEEP